MSHFAGIKISSNKTINNVDYYKSIHRSHRIFFIIIDIKYVKIYFWINYLIKSIYFYTVQFLDIKYHNKYLSK